MGKIGKYLLFGLMVMVLTACPPNCEYRLIDYGLLSEEALAWSPYVDGQSYSFIHSGGQVISFTASRTREIHSEYWDECLEIRYERDYTTLIPDYPIFNCNIDMFKSDSTRFEFYVRAGGSVFGLPFSEGINIPHGYYDSLLIGPYWYKEVYTMTNHVWDGNPPGQILAHKLIYNTSYGILKILMSNDEYYEISE